MKSRNIAIVFTFIAFSIFNFNRDIIGIYSYQDGKWLVLPLLTDAFFRLMPLLNISWLAEIGLNGMLLRSGRWTTATRLFSIGTKIFQIVIIALMLAGLEDLLGVGSGSGTIRAGQGGAAGPGGRAQPWRRLAGFRYGGT